MTARYIVVGVDFTEPSLAAARWVAAHLIDGEDLILAHAICIPEPPRFLRGFLPPVTPLLEDARRGAELRLRELSPALGSARIWPEIRRGRPDEVLIEIAQEYRAELVVVGPHGDKPGMWKLLGGTAEHVTWRIQSPVLLARGLPTGAAKTLLVALDESDGTPSVIRWAGRVAKRNRSDVIVMHVVNPLLAGAVAVAAGTVERRRAEEQLRQGSETWLREQIAGTDLEGAATETAFGDPGFEILGAIKRFGADLVVVGRNSPGRGRAVWLGGTATFVLRNGDGPVLVVSSQLTP
jgi:nucleotide-binding universal stress UspA family protein